MRLSSLLPVLLSLLFSACASSPATPIAPAQLPLEPLTLEPGVQLSANIPPDLNPNPPEANPRVLLEIHITDDAGKPIMPDSVQVAEQRFHPGADSFSVMVDGNSAQPVVVKVGVNGFEPWYIELPFHLQHSRHFAMVVRLNRKPFFNEMDYE